jgi:hypothetical protein
LISYEITADIDNILNNNLKIADIINSMLRPQKTLEKTRIELYNILSLPALEYGSANWTTKAREAKIITAAEMEYKRKAAG